MTSVETPRIQVETKAKQKVRFAHVCISMFPKKYVGCRKQKPKNFVKLPGQLGCLVYAVNDKGDLVRRMAKDKSQYLRLSSDLYRLILELIHMCVCVCYIYTTYKQTSAYTYRSFKLYMKCSKYNLVFYCCHLQETETVH